MQVVCEVNREAWEDHERAAGTGEAAKTRRAKNSIARKTWLGPGWTAKQIEFDGGDTEVLTGDGRTILQ